MDSINFNFTEIYMANIIELEIHSDKRGSLVSIEKCLPFNVNRTYVIYNINGKERGGHRHKDCWQALVVLQGSCVVKTNNGVIQEKFLMDNPNKVLILKPEDWHKMSKFKNNVILMVLASHHYDIKDYIYEDYR